MYPGKSRTSRVWAFSGSAPFGKTADQFHQAAAQFLLPGFGFFAVRRFESQFERRGLIAFKSIGDRVEIGQVDLAFLLRPAVLCRC